MFENFLFYGFRFFEVFFQGLTFLLLLSFVILGGLWGYSKYVLDQGVIPQAQLNLECNWLGLQSDKQLLEILVHLKNVGQSLLVVGTIGVRLRYLIKSDEVCLESNTKSPKYGRILFPNSLTNTFVKQDSEVDSFIPILSHSTFVQPGVDQIYTLVIGVPDSASFALLQAKFPYEPKITPLQRQIFEWCKNCGLLSSKLKKIEKPHTIERAFALHPKDSSAKY